MTQDERRQVALDIEYLLDAAKYHDGVAQMLAAEGVGPSAEHRCWAAACRRAVAALKKRHRTGKSEKGE
jgi:hypothetical protein